MTVEFSLFVSRVACDALGAGVCGGNQITFHADSFTPRADHPTALVISARPI